MCEAYNYQYKLNYRTLMPCNTFGPGDNYNSQTSHFLPALIKKFMTLKLENQKYYIYGAQENQKRIHICRVI